MSETEQQLADAKRVAMVAAEAATIAAAELLRFAREGASCNRPFGLEDPVAQLAEALEKAIGIETPFLAAQPCYAEEREQADQLASAIRKWQSDAGAV